MVPQAHDGLCVRVRLQCDFCFERAEDSILYSTVLPGEWWNANNTAAEGKCVFKCSQDEAQSIQARPAQCSSTYAVTRGYKKIEGNKCRGGLDLSPLERACDASRHRTVTADSEESTRVSRRGSGLVTVLIVMAVLGVAGVAVYK